MNPTKPTAIFRTIVVSEWMGGSAIGSKNVQGVVDKTDNAKCAPHILSRRNGAKNPDPKNPD